MAHSSAVCVPLPAGASRMAHSSAVCVPLPAGASRRGFKTTKHPGKNCITFLITKT